MSSKYNIHTAQNVTLVVNTASLGTRLLAYIIDSVLKGGYILTMIYLIFLTNDESYILMALLALPIMLYSILFEVFNNGQTPGKSIMQIQVQSLEGGEVSIGSYLLRWLLRIVDFSLMNGLVAFIAIAAGEKSQRIGDMAAGTTVVSLKSKTSHSKAVLGQVSATYTPVYEGAEYLSEKNIQVIKKILIQKPSPGRNSAIKKIIPKVENVIGETNRSNTNILFLSDVVKDYYFFESGIQGSFE